MKAIVRRVWVASMMLPRAGTTTRSDPRRKGHCHSGWTPGRALEIELPPTAADAHGFLRVA